MYTEPSSCEPALMDWPTTRVAKETTTALATDPTAGLRTEIAQMRVDNDDLRASAALWSLLYDAAIQRATELEARLAGVRNDTIPSPT